MTYDWLHAVKRLAALAETGLHYGAADFDRERYAELREIATAMAAALADAPPEAMAGLIGDHTAGYATPKVDVRAAIRDGDRLLLMRERTDGRWAMPGGFADVGLSPRENVEKEVREEVGLTVRATRLYHLRHKAKGAYEPDFRDFYKLFFLCEVEGTPDPRPGPEALEVGWFTADAWPPLSTGRTTAEDCARALTASDGLGDFD